MIVETMAVIATARATIAGVKQAIALGKDASDLFHQFFDAKDAVMKVKANPPKKSFQSANSEAMQIIQLAEEMQQVEEQIKISFMRRGKTNLWMDFLRERNAIVARNKAEEIEADNAKAKRAKEIEEVIEMGLLLVAIAGLLTLVAWGTAQYVDFMRA
jgi:hypothetical protein|tara:strand:+ start:420 stop:893 length:474 start_codon:yes stop_codon:yes gene_type:complete